MADLTKEQFEQLPDFMKSDYSEVDGSYKNIALMTVKKTANDLDSKLKASIEDKAAINERLNAFESLKAKELEAAREEALEQARKENNVDEILKLEREVIADERKVLIADREALDELQAGIAGDKKTVIADRLTEHATDDGKAAFNMLVKNFIVVDSKTREKTFLNVDGSASSINDETEYLAYLAKQSLFKPLLKATVVTENGGMANGGLDGSASSKDPKLMNGAERLALKKSNPAAFFAAFPKN